MAATQRSLLDFFGRLHPCLPRQFQIVMREHAPERQPRLKFPTYCSPLLNIANQYGRGTRPEVVGQLSDLVREIRPVSVEEWKDKYYTKHPEAKANAADRIERTVHNLRQALESIDRPMIEQWVDDLLINKTFTGFSYEGIVLKELANRTMGDYRASSTEDERKGIDGWVKVGTVYVPVQIKPESHRRGRNRPEKFTCPIVYYLVKQDCLHIDAREFQQEARLRPGQ